MMIQKINANNNTDRQSFKGSVDWKTLGKIGEELCSDSLSPELKAFKAEIDMLAKKSLPDDCVFSFNSHDNYRDNASLITTIERGETTKGTKGRSVHNDWSFFEHARTPRELLLYVKKAVQSEINVIEGLRKTWADWHSLY